nr:integrase, catalytic region, zinc finger, CCHC-type, peptidase aspartic, catalytic [Tanacetum cinerariifolium]
MLLEGSQLTKDERESQLYDEFEHFCQNKGETIHEYYVRFTKVIKDMRNIKIIMPKMQLKSKFVSNMFPEWDRFVTTVKLNRGMKTSNYNQLYACLKQHEAHGNENKMMLERYNQHVIDPLAFVSNVSPQQYPIQSSAILQYAYVPPENGVVLDKEQLFFILADQCDAFDSDVDEAHTTQTMFMANLSSANPIYDDVGPSYDSNILSEVQDYDNYLDSVGEYHEVHEMQTDVQPNYVVDSDAEYTSDSNSILYEHSMQVQSALYNGHEIVKTNHASAVMHNSEDTLELAEITRKRMLEKVKSPLCVEKKVKIVPPDYSKENYHATFTP